MENLVLPLYEYISTHIIYIYEYHFCVTIQDYYYFMWKEIRISVSAENVSSKFGCQENLQSRYLKQDQTLQLQINVR